MYYTNIITTILSIMRVGLFSIVWGATGRSPGLAPPSPRGHGPARVTGRGGARRALGRDAAGTLRNSVAVARTRASLLSIVILWKHNIIMTAVVTLSYRSLLFIVVQCHALLTNKMILSNFIGSTLCMRVVLRHAYRVCA